MSLSDRLERAKKVKSNETDALGFEFLDFSTLEEEQEQFDEYDELKKSVHREVIDSYNKLLVEGNPEEEIDVRELIEKILNQQAHLVSRSRKESLVQEILDEVTGFGPIEVLLRDENVSEIMVNGPRQVYIERSGKLELSHVFFKDNDHVMQTIDKIVSPLGRRCDESNPMVDARLPDGSRVNAIVPPLALNGPTITIRKFNSTPLQVEDLIDFKSLSFEMASFLKACVMGRCNIMVSGGTGSGKTTLLNVLSSFIPETERIVTIEDAAELKMMQEHVVSLESRPANVEGKGKVDIRDLVKNSLRMRPDRIIVGEVRSGEALDMLQAMNTGHDGSLATAHANTPRDMVARLETMVMMAGMDLPVKAIREQIASAIDIIVQQTRLRDGSRKIVAISEVTGMEGDIVTLQDIFVFKSNGFDGYGKLNGEFVSTGIRPYVLDTLDDNGISYRDEWFSK
ncbi:MAG TPA: CpaF family protein [Erysipelothrix sp.]